MRKIAFICLLLCISLIFCGFTEEKQNNFIKWVDLNVPYEVLLKAYEINVSHYKTGNEYDYCESLAYIATKNGNKFQIKRDIRELIKLENEVNKGKKINGIFGEDKYYKYYLEAYKAIFSQFIGEYFDPSTNENKYGLKNYHPIPQGYWYNHYDDFGASRSYGFRRVHLGHDLMGSIGTPIVAVEGGTITDIGWNRYGGWRIGIRSFDNLRSYYYAHFRKTHPYVEGLKEGDRVEAGQVIGYLGVTGYSYKENANMKCKPHLHFGMQLIFDESQIKGPTEIWIDMYSVSKFLSHNRAKVIKGENDYRSVDIYKIKNT